MTEREGVGAMVEPDTIIDGRYKVISRVGSGGMADVYLAEDQLLGRQVAVKLLHHHFAEDQEFVERFRREASSAAGLSHQNIVGIFDRGEWEGTYYIAMEYVAGRSLKTIVREQGPLDPAQAIDIVIQILRGARFAHRRGVVHRDLKPHNVIIDEEGRARVTDFGIARAGASDMTLTGSIMGTAQYLSPEQAQGYMVSGASDLYSIGVILYELLTGVVPFDGETAVAIAFKQVSAQPRPPSEVNPAVPPALDAVVLRALAKDPAQRYADADEFIAALVRERQALPASASAVLARRGGQRARLRRGGGARRRSRRRRPAPDGGRRPPARCCSPTTATTTTRARATGPASHARAAVGAAGGADRRRDRRGGAAAVLADAPGDRAERDRRNRTGGLGEAARGRAQRGAVAGVERDGRQRARDQPVADGRQQGRQRLEREHRRLQRPGQRGADERRRADVGAGGQPPAQSGLQADEQATAQREGRAGQRDRHRTAGGHGAAGGQPGVGAGLQRAGAGARAGRVGRLAERRRSGADGGRPGGRERSPQQVSAAQTGRQRDRADAVGGLVGAHRQRR